MTLFITAVLILAAVQSFCKFSLIPRRWELPLVLFLAGLPFCFEERIASSSLQELNTVLSSPETLSNWCALVVIQELISLVAGFSLLAGRGEEDKKRSGWRKYIGVWKYLVFFPSLLLPTGALYLQMYLFNRLVNWDFNRISWVLAAALPLALVITAELFRLFYRNIERRILAVMHLEYFLLLPAIFLPVAATAELIPDTAGGTLSPDSWFLILLLLAFEIVTTLIFYIYRRKKYYVHRHSNS